MHCWFVGIKMLVFWICVVIACAVACWWWCFCYYIPSDSFTLAAYKRVRCCSLYCFFSFYWFSSYSPSTSLANYIKAHRKRRKKTPTTTTTKSEQTKKWLWTCFQMKDGFSEHNTVRFLLTSVRLIVRAWSASGKYGFSVSSFFVFCLACFASLFFSSNQILFFFVVVVVCSLFIIRSWFINIRSLWLFCQLFVVVVVSK